MKKTFIILINHCFGNAKEIGDLIEGRKFDSLKEVEIFLKGKLTHFDLTENDIKFDNVNIIALPLFLFKLKINDFVINLENYYLTYVYTNERE